MIKEYWDGVDRDDEGSTLGRDDASVMVTRPAFEEVLRSELAGARVLDVGADDYERALVIARRGAKLVVLDPDEERLDEIFQRLAMEGQQGELVVGRPDEMRAIPDSSVDLVTAGTLIAAAPDLERVYREFHRVLRVGGGLLISVPHPMLSGGKPITSGAGTTDWLLHDYFQQSAAAPGYDREGRPFGSATYYARTLDGYINPMVKAGFAVDSIHEPRPDPRTKSVSNTSWNLFNRIPQRLIIKAIRRS